MELLGLKLSASKVRILCRPTGFAVNHLKVPYFYEYLLYVYANDHLACSSYNARYYDSHLGQDMDVFVTLYSTGG